MNTENEKRKLLPFGVKLGYSLGQSADAIPYNLFYIYFLFFFTNVVGMNPAIAGVISFISILWSAFVDPVSGYLSDNCKSKYGRRRPFLLGATFPLAVCMVLLFTTVHFGATLNFVYYLIMAILLWTCFSFYAIPFFALGAEISQDYQERNSLRSLAGLFIYISVWLVSAGPMMVLDKVTKAGGTPQFSWMLSAMILGGLTIIAVLICWRTTRGREMVDRRVDLMAAQESGKANIFKNYRELFKIRAFKMVLGATLFSTTSISVASAAFVYLMNNNLGFTADVQAKYWSVYTIMTICIIPITFFISKLIGKKRSLITFQIFSILASFYFFTFGVYNFTELIIFTFFTQLANVAFWTVGVAMTYDVCEVDEYINDKRREGAITGFVSFIQKLGSAIGLWISGVMLAVFGYDGTTLTQTPTVLKGILSLNTLAPALFGIIVVVFVILYPISPKNFTALMAAMPKKKAGQPHSTEDFDDLLPKKGLK